MELILKRIAKKKDYTIGRLYVGRTMDEGRCGASHGGSTKDEGGCGASHGGSVMEEGRCGASHGGSTKEDGGCTSTSNLETSTSPEATHHTSTLNPHTYFCDTLEPTWRDYRNGGRKIKGRSAIPEGRYAVVITWSPRLKQWLPLLLGVPMFSGIRIHAGNTAKDTAGCILVGQNLKRGMVLNSRIWLKRLKDKIVEAKARGEGVWITVM